jgi:hypothetical protein
MFKRARRSVMDEATQRRRLRSVSGAEPRAANDNWLAPLSFSHFLMVRGDLIIDRTLQVQVN